MTMTATTLQGESWAGQTARLCLRPATHDDLEAFTVDASL